MRQRIAEADPDNPTNEYPEQIADRLALGAIAQRLTEAINELERRMRADVDSLI